MFLMSGMSGAGKTEFSKRFSDENNLQYMGIEDFYAKRFGSELIHQDEEAVWADFEKALHKCEADSIDIIIDTNSPRRADREWFVERFPVYNISLIIVEAELSICLKNNQTRARKIPDDEMIAIYKSLEKVTDDEMKNYDAVFLYRNTDNSGVNFVSRLK